MHSEEEEAAEKTALLKSQKRALKKMAKSLRNAREGGHSVPQHAEPDSKRFNFDSSSDENDMTEFLERMEDSMHPTTADEYAAFHPVAAQNHRVVL